MNVFSPCIEKALVQLTSWAKHQQKEKPMESDARTLSKGAVSKGTPGRSPGESQSGPSRVHAFGLNSGLSTDPAGRLHSTREGAGTVIMQTVSAEEIIK